ncbi:class I SAM-dependent methyltransferase [Candidatus Latescibacterota bacterium]
MEQRDIIRFSKREIENQKFWTRLGGMPDFKGKTVLDVGCGQGGLCVDMALAGAEKVVGLDIEQRVIDFAIENMEQNFPQIQSKTTFECIDLVEYDTTISFDYIISKDSFEHIQNVPLMLKEMKKRLSPGGKIYIGFGPLYNSMNGSHMERFLIPWGHLFIPTSLYLKITEWDRRHPMESMESFGLNRNSFKEYKKFFKESGLKTVYFKTNKSVNRIVRSFRYLAMIPLLSELFTMNIYCILEKPENSAE